MTAPTIDRRKVFVSILAAATIASSAARARAKLRKIGVLWHAATPEEEAIYQAPLKQGFLDLGYLEGRDYELIETYAAEKYERFNANAAKLVEMQVDVIVAVTGPATAAAQRATKTVPIVFLVVPDPVGRGYAQSLSHPGGNLTGLSTVAADLSQKRLEFVKETMPDLSRISLFVNAKDPQMSGASLERTRIAGAALGIAVEVFQITDPEDLDAAFTDAERAGIRAAIFMQDPMFFNERARLARLSLSRGIATMVANGVMVGDGCLLSYGPNFPAQFRRVGLYVDRIFKGQHPSEIAIEEPTRFELVVNLKTARALGLAIPQSILIRADEVVE